MVKQQTKQIEALTAQEIQHQIREFRDRRMAVVNELAQIFVDRKGDSGPQKPPLSEHARAARERAKALLNGHSPPEFAVPTGQSREQELEVERAACDLILVTLQKSEVAARARASLAFAEANRERWAATVREMLLAAMKLAELGEHARKIARGVDGCARLPLDRYIGGRVDVHFAGWPVREVLPTAIELGLVSPGEAREVQDLL
jgi:hypothetical protein